MIWFRLLSNTYEADKYCNWNTSYRNDGGVSEMVAFSNRHEV
jgi:hypothetical protein